MNHPSPPNTHPHPQQPQTINQQLHSLHPHHSQEQEQDYTEEILQMLQCPTHLQPYLCLCNVAECGEFVCGSIECLQAHFHNEVASLTKLDRSQVSRKLKLLKGVQSRVESYRSSLSEVQERVNDLKTENIGLFQKRKRINQMGEQHQIKPTHNTFHKLHLQYHIKIHLQNTASASVIQLLNLKSNIKNPYSLSNATSLPLTQRFFDSVHQTHQIAQQMQRQANTLTQSINWSLVWISLRSESEIIPKLKLSFQEFRYLGFLKRDSPFHQFQKRWTEIDQADFQYEGIVTLIFSKQNIVVGEFVGNSNVETAKLFLSSFVFMADINGKMRRTRVTRNVLWMVESNKGKQTDNLLYFEKEELGMKQLVKESKIGECLSVDRVQSFYVIGS